MKKIFFLLIILLNLCAFANVQIKVLKVYDGDSILAQIKDNIFRIRLIDIDCFEGTPNERAKWQAKENKTTVEQINFGGNIARKILKEKIENKKLDFEFQGIDKYGRALGILYLNGVNINKEMLKSPYCSSYKKR